MKRFRAWKFLETGPKFFVQTLTLWEAVIRVSLTTALCGYLSQKSLNFRHQQVAKSHSSCSCWYQFSKIPNAFLIRSGAQRNFAHTDIRPDIPYRSTVSDFQLTTISFL